MDLGEGAQHGDPPGGDQRQAGGGVRVVGELDVGLVDDDQPGRAGLGEMLDLGAAADGAGGVVRIDQVGDVSGDAGHRVQVVRPVAQRHAGQAGADHVRADLVDAVGGSAYRVPLLGEVGPGEQEDQLIRSVADQNLVGVDAV